MVQKNLQFYKVCKKDISSLINYNIWLKISKISNTQVIYQHQVNSFGLLNKFFHSSICIIGAVPENFFSLFWQPNDAVPFCRKNTGSPSKSDSSSDYDFLS